jgi:TetR/AcrR family transcriptional regulator
MAAVRDPEATKRRILDAARKEFAAKGIAGARVDAIAKRARTNKRMIYYYFGSKDGLFREILRRKLAESTERLRSAPDRPHGERLVDRQASLLADLDYVRLLMWEALETSPRRPVAAEAERAEVYRTVMDRLRDEQSSGALPDDLDVRHLLLTEVALTLMPLAFPQLTRLITGTAVTDPTFLDDRQAFLERFAAHLARVGSAGIEPATKGL